jgi:hypothetical protein
LIGWYWEYLSNSKKREMKAFACMDKYLIEEINEAVDRGDELVKQKLLECFEEMVRFVERLTLASGLTGKGALGSASHPLAPNSEGIIRLVICLFVFQDSVDYPSWVAAWYNKASAWSMADAGLWDESGAD